MRLFIRGCNNCQRPIYLNVVEPTRGQLANRIGYYFQVECPHCRGDVQHSVNDVFAEPDPPATPAGAIVGGVIGLIGGPIGMLIGGGLGTLWGANVDEEERRRVDRFNGS